MNFFQKLLNETNLNNIDIINSFQNQIKNKYQKLKDNSNPYIHPNYPITRQVPFNYLDEYVSNTNKDYVLSKDIYISFEKQIFLNPNILVLGDNRNKFINSLVIPNLFQKNSSYIIFDENNNIYSKTHEYFEKAGYSVKVLDTTNNNSIKYNPLMWIGKDMKEIEEFVSLFVKCMQNYYGLNVSNDLFWTIGEEKLVCALIYYIIETSNTNKEIEKNLTFANISKLLKLFRKSKNNDKLLEIDILFENHRKKMGAPTPSLIYYDEFMKNKESIRKSIVISTFMHFGIFANKQLSSITTHDCNKENNLRLDNIDDKTIIYVNSFVDNDKNNFLSLLLYHQIYKSRIHKVEANNEKLQPLTIFINNLNIFSPLCNTKEKQKQWDILQESLSQVKKTNMRHFVLINNPYYIDDKFFDIKIYIGSMTQECCTYISKLINFDKKEFYSELNKMQRKIYKPNIDFSPIDISVMNRNKNLVFIKSLKPLFVDSL